MQILLREIERHINETGVPQTRFGRNAVSDPRLVRDLRNGRAPKPGTTARIRAFIEANGPPPVTPACAALLAALRARAGAGFAAEARSESWRCAELVGERHCLTLRFMGWHRATRADRLVRGLSEHEFALPGLFVADIVVGDIVANAGGSCAWLEALTLEA